MSKVFAAICAALVAAPLIGIATDAAAQGAQSGGRRLAPQPGAAADSAVVDSGIGAIFVSAAASMAVLARASVFMILGTTRSGVRDSAMASMAITRLRLG